MDGPWDGGVSSSSGKVWWGWSTFWDSMKLWKSLESPPSRVRRIDIDLIQVKVGPGSSEEKLEEELDPGSMGMGTALT